MVGLGSAKGLSRDARDSSTEGVTTGYGSSRVASGVRSVGAGGWSNGGDAYDGGGGTDDEARARNPAAAKEKVPLVARGNEAIVAPRSESSKMPAARGAISTFQMRPRILIRNARSYRSGCRRSPSPDQRDLRVRRNPWASRERERRRSRGQVARARNRRGGRHTCDESAPKESRACARRCVRLHPDGDVAPSLRGTQRLCRPPRPPISTAHEDAKCHARLLICLYETRHPK